MSPEWPDLQWIPPRSYTHGRRAGQPTKITVHYTAGHEGFDDAENGALYDQRRTDGVSSHYYVDANSVVQCVRTTDESHTALEHGNNEGIHYELCGTAQTRAQWLDPVSRATIRNAAGQMARDMKKYQIPLVRLIGRDVRDSLRRGVCGHVDWTTGWPEDGGTHTDPGVSFPWDVLFYDIDIALNESEEDMTTLQDPTNTISVPATAGRAPAGSVTGNASAYLGHHIRRQDEDAIAIRAKLDAILFDLGEAAQEDAQERELAALERARETAEDAAEIERDVAQSALIATMVAGDPTVIAQRLIDVLGPELAEAVRDEIPTVLNRTHLTVDPPPAP